MKQGARDARGNGDQIALSAEDFHVARLRELGQVHRRDTRNDAWALSRTTTPSSARSRTASDETKMPRTNVSDSKRNSTVWSPGGSGTAFAEQAREKGLLLIPGGVFSARDSHFRLSYAADDATLERGLSILRSLARG